MGLGSNSSTGAPNLQGFHEFLGDLDQTDCHNMYPPLIWKVTRASARFEGQLTLERKSNSEFSSSHHIPAPPCPQDRDTLPLAGNARPDNLPSRETCMVDPAANGFNWTHDVFTAAAASALVARAAEPSVPFFLFVSWTDPHAGGWTLDNDETGNPVPGDGDFAGQNDWPLVERDHASVIQNYQVRRSAQGKYKNR